MSPERNKFTLAQSAYVSLQLLSAVLLVNGGASSTSERSLTILSGRQLVAALTDPSSTEALLPADVLLSARDFDGYPQPIVLRRNFTVRGVPDRWPLLDFGGVKRKVQLQNGSVLTLRYVVLKHIRDGTTTQTPGLDLLVPSPLDRPSVVHGDFTALYNQICLPKEQAVNALQTMARPAAHPGNQTFVLTIEQSPDCLNAGTTQAAQFQAAPYMERCWASIARYEDVACEGADVDPITGRAVFSGYTVLMTHFFSLCEGFYPAQCISELGPAGCALYVKSKALQRRPPPLAVAPDGGSAAGGDHRRSVLAPVLGSVLGVLAGALILAVAWYLLARFRKLQHKERCSGGCSPDKGIELSVDNDRSQRSIRSAAAVTLTTGDLEPDADADTWVRPLAVKALENSELSDAVITMSTPPREDVHTGVVIVESTEPGSRGAGLELPHAALRADACLAAHALADHGRLCGEVSGAGGGSVVGRGDSGSGPMPVPRPAPAEVRLTGVLLGRGAYGRVYEGMYCGRTVAVKLLAAWEGRPGGGVAQAARLPAGRPGSCGAEATSLQAPDGSPGLNHECDEQGMRAVPNVAGAVAIVAEGGKASPKANGGDGAALSFEATGGDALHNLAREVELLGRCRHPAIVRLLAVSLAPPRPCLVMERCDTSLQAMLHGDGGGEVGCGKGARRPLLPLSKVLHIGSQIAAGLEYLHPTITHRDLKPGNVLINGADSEWPEAKLADFGLSRLRLATMATVTPEAGTPAYVAPECYDVTNFFVTHHADMYSLGVVLWEMLAGRRPWQGLSPVDVAVRVTLHGERLPLDQLSSARCPPPLADLIAQCWEADPRRRPAAAEVAKRLTLMLGQ